MELKDYLMEINEHELCDKLERIIKQFHEKEEIKAKFISSNNEYNTFLQNKMNSFENFEKIKEAPFYKLRNRFSKIKETLGEYYFLIWLLVILLPGELLLMIIMFLPAFILPLVATNKSFKIIEDSINKQKKALIDKQNELYEKTSSLRQEYHSTKKEYFNELISLTDEELNILKEFYIMKNDYDEYVSLIEELSHKEENIKQKQLLLEQKDE